jgi:hypothetical protein
MQRRLSAILAADVVGYSRLMGKDEAGTLDALKALRKGLVAALAHVGRLDEARRAAQEARRQLPDLSISYLQRVLPTKDPKGLDPYLEGLRMAGLVE